MQLLKRIYARVTKSEGLLATVMLSLGNFGGTFISAIALIIFSRILGPSEFGVFSTLFALMQIMVRLTDFGVVAALDRTVAGVYDKNRREARQYMIIALYLKCFISFLMIIAAVGFSPVIADMLRIQNILLVRWSAILSLATAIFEYVSVLYQSTQQFATVSKMTIAQASGKLFVGIIAIALGSLSITSVLLIYGLMPGIIGLLFIKKSPLRVINADSESLNQWRKATKTLLSVTTWTAIATVTATLADNIDTLLIQSFLTSHETGLWSAASRIASFTLLIPWSIGIVLNVRVARYRDPSHLRAYLHKAHLAAIGSFLLILVGIPLSGLGIWVTAGNAYLAATPALELMLLAAALAAATAPYASLFYVLDYPVYYALAGIIGSVALIGLDFIGIPWGGLIGAGLARVVARAGVLVFTILFAAYGIHRQFHKST